VLLTANQIIIPVATAANGSHIGALSGA